ncbi:hypothetical protein ACFLSJ_05190 [Verrucomicrobiota bacterium]
MFDLSVTVDFDDDVADAAFDRDMFRQMMAVFRDWGMRRMYWIDYGDFSLFAQDPFRAAANVRQTIENVGSLRRTAVECGHEAGLEVHAVVKPFDIGFAALGSTCAALSDNPGRMQSLSRVEPWCMDIVRQRPELRMRHRAAAEMHDLESRPIERIEVTGADDRPILATEDNVNLYVSDDNRGYRPCETAGRPRLTRQKDSHSGEAVWKLAWEGLRLDTPFLLLHSEIPWGGPANRWDRLVTLLDTENRIIPSTPGILVSRARDIGEMTVVHNHAPGCPTGGSSWQADHVATDTGFSLCGEQSCLGIAVGVDPYVPGVLCPAEPAARELLLDWVRACLDDGMDGIDLRPGSHCSPFDWYEYGFNDAVVDAYRKRHGSDIIEEGAQVAKKAAIMGEGYTQFLAEASALTRSRGKVVAHHVQGDFFAKPGNPESGLDREVFFMGIDWAVEDWLRSGLVDEITVKGPVPGCWEATRKHIVALATEVGLPYRYCPWHSDAKGRYTRYEALRRQVHRARMDEGAAGFNVYESAAVLDIRPGVVKPWNENLTEIFRHDEK